MNFVLNGDSEAAKVLISSNHVSISVVNNEGKYLENLVRESNIEELMEELFGRLRSRHKVK